jgi:proteic killer suppression protein
MEISFKTKKIATLCNKNNKAVKKFGADCAEKLQLRLQQLWSAECLEDMKYGRPHPLNGNREGQFAIDLAGAVRLKDISIKKYDYQNGNELFYIITMLY